MNKKITYKFLGNIGVDSGSVMIGDPCYQEDEDSRKLIFDTQMAGYEQKPPVYQHAIPYLKGHEGLAVVSNTTYGDGTYPVFGMVQDGQIVGMTVLFNPWDAPNEFRDLIYLDDGNWEEQTECGYCGSAQGHFDRCPRE